MTQSGFGDIDFYQQKKQIVERFDVILPKIKALNKGYYYLQAVQRFRDALTFKFHDLGKLPVYSTTGRSLTRSKTNCVLGLFSLCIQHYNHFCNKVFVIEAAELGLQKLASIVNSGLDEFELVKYKSGYVLERKK